jgi:hypothetical protein
MLVIILTCQKNKEKQRLVRKVLKDKNINYLFISGGALKNEIHNDTLSLNVEDTYEFLHLKITKAYEFLSSFKTDILKVDDDSFIDTLLLKKYNFNFDYGGILFSSFKGEYTYHADKVTDKRYSSAIKSDLIYKFCAGGAYFLSRKAQKIFIQNYKTSEEYSNHLKFLKGREDRLVGQTLFPFFSSLKLVDDGCLFNFKDIYSVFGHSVFHSIDEQHYELLSNKKYPKFFLNSIAKVV